MYTLSLHDALPISHESVLFPAAMVLADTGDIAAARELSARLDSMLQSQTRSYSRSEEHTSELQSLAYLVCRLLLENMAAGSCSTSRISLHVSSLFVFLF